MRPTLRSLRRSSPRSAAEPVDGRRQNRGRARARRHHRSGRPAGGRLPRPQGRRPAGGHAARDRPGDRRGRARRRAAAGLALPGARRVRRPRPGGRPRPAGRRRRVRGRQVGAVGGDRLPAHPRRAGLRRPPSAGGPGRAAGRPRSRGPAAAGRARGAQRRREPGLDRPLGARAGHRRAAARPALRRPALPPLGAGLDGAHPGAAVRRPARLAGATSAGCTTPATRPSRSPRPPTPSTSTSIDPGAHPRTAVLLGAEGPGLTPEAQAAARVRARIPMRAGVDSLGVAAAAAIAFATLR